jgi:DNA polymerase-1
MKMAMIKVDDHLNKNYPDANMLLQIHDSVLVECAEKDAEKLGHELKTIMEKVYDLSVKLVVDVAIGDNWGDL